MSAPVQRRQLAAVIALADYRPQPPAPVQRGEDAHRSRATLAACWQRSQLRRDLIEVGTGLLLGAVLLAVLLWVASVAGWLPV